MKLNNKLLLFLVAVAIVSRFVGLDFAPPHLSNDEIGAAYDAYSISRTLKDEHNQFLPTTFQSHGIYRSALAVYLTLPGVVIFGNTDFGARVPSAVMGSLTILLVGLLVWELSQNYQLALLSSLMLAFSPWHFSASRSAMESNYALFFVTLGVYLFFYGLLRKNNLVTLLSFIALAASLYGYYTEWGLTPLVILGLLVSYRRVIIKEKIYLVGLGLFLILLTPLALDFIDKLGSSRASTELFYNDLSTAPLLESDRFNTFQKSQILMSAALEKYSGYLSLNYLFFYGSTFLPKENPYQVGIFLSPFLLAFLVGLFKLREFFKQHATFLYIWLFISPAVPALSRGETSSVRGLGIVVPLSIIIAVGVLDIWENLRKRLVLKVSGIGLLGLSFFYFLLIYIGHYPLQRAVDFQYGYKQMALYISKHYPKYEKIVIDPRFGNREFY
ncbi:MAG: glycosyltransferase family 39 protein, partial [Candidatus Daviesbacteria bacterium]|nr:glycosyltransferase family 39 protein [Candidatus Daviesbacteria bacterium]